MTKIQKEKTMLNCYRPKSLSYIVPFNDFDNERMIYGIFRLNGVKSNIGDCVIGKHFRCPKIKIQIISR